MINKEQLSVLPVWKKKRKEKENNFKPTGHQNQTGKSGLQKTLRTRQFFFFLFTKHRYFATQAIIDISKSNGMVNVVTRVEMTVLC